ncbi:hypothetical protein N799_10360 [Lysobacter arseniciresistens ZS79]|uniref:Uncharacterized protein n=1 Tax=Lysobacter arseniciresistens ZS79 TaxID=913325 RepID=A0A0A0F338_9GAMM|nr:hypothetical protein N799_10360 [Lysobacter arseniciresistens ZS79]
MVIAFVTAQVIIADATFQTIVAHIAPQVIVPGITKELISTVSTSNDVIASTGINNIVTAVTHDRVGGFVAINHIVGLAGLQYLLIDRSGIQGHRVTVAKVNRQAVLSQARDRIKLGGECQLISRISAEVQHQALAITSEVHIRSNNPLKDQSAVPTLIVYVIDTIA